VPAVVVDLTVWRLALALIVLVVLRCQGRIWCLAGLRRLGGVSSCSLEREMLCEVVMES